MDGTLMQVEAESGAQVPDRPHQFAALKKSRSIYGSQGHGRLIRDYREAGDFMCVIDVVTWISSGGAVRFRGKTKVSAFMMNQSFRTIEKWLAKGLLKRAIVISERRQVPRDLDRDYAGSEVKK